MPEWLLTFLIGTVILGLVGIIWNQVMKRINKIEDWKERSPMADEVLTKSVHAEICKENTKDLRELIHQNGIAISKQIQDMKDYFDVKIERDILSELRKLNGE